MGGSHGANFDLVRDHGSKLDQGFSALIEDLDGRGMLDDVTVIAWGEFGRTPRINNTGGRDHWPQVSCALLAAVTDPDRAAAKRAMDAMMTMRKIDIAAIEAARAKQ